jgi:rod shape determining protein RodA
VNRLVAGPQTPLARLRRAIDWVVFTLALGLILLGIVNLESATSSGADLGLSSEVRGQLGFLGLGLLAMSAAAAIDYRVYYRAAYPIYAIGVSLVLLVLLVGTTINNATRWLNVGILFQPSELVKLVVVIGVARYLQDLGPTPEGSRLKRIIVPIGMALLPAAFVLKQPDLSTAILIMLIVGMMLAVFEMRLRTIMGSSLASVIGFALAWRFVLADYQKERINVWLDPESYPDAGGYQILQARTAVGNGGILGRGVGQGTQNLLDFVPYKASDFSFAVFAEEWGFVGSLMLIGLFLVLVLWGINLASQARDRYAAALCVGISGLIFWHAVLNMGVVLEFFPNTGLPLPFFSQGGSNVLTMMLALGVLMSVSRSRKWR